MSLLYTMLKVVKNILFVGIHVNVDKDILIIQL